MRVFITQLDVPPPAPAFFATGITAAPGGQTGATLLTARSNNVTIVAAANGVRLNAGIPGGLQHVYNRGANPLLLFPDLSTGLEGYGLNVLMELPVGDDTWAQFDGTQTWLLS